MQNITRNIIGAFTLFYRLCQATVVLSVIALVVFLTEAISTGCHRAAAASTVSAAGDATTLTTPAAAAVTPSSLSPAAPSAPERPNQAPFSVAVALLVPLIIEGIKFLAPRVPKVWLPFLCPVLGAALDIIANLASGHPTFGASTGYGAVLGTVGIGIREMVDQLKKARAESETTGPAIKLMAAGGLLLLATGCKTSITVQDLEAGRFVGISTPAWPWSDTSQTLAKMTASLRDAGTTVSLSGVSQESVISTNGVALVKEAAKGFGEGLARGAAGGL